MVLFIGIPGSGKSSFYKEKFFTTHIRVNLDMLRTRKREMRLLEFCMNTSMRLVVDNTNVTREERERYITLGKVFHFRIIGYYFRSDLIECMNRNSQRQGKEKIPERGLRSMFKKMKPPEYSEGFDELYEVQIAGEVFEINPVK